MMPRIGFHAETLQLFTGNKEPLDKYLQSRSNDEVVEDFHNQLSEMSAVFKEVQESHEAEEAKKREAEKRATDNAADSISSEETIKPAPESNEDVFTSDARKSNLLYSVSEGGPSAIAAQCHTPPGAAAARAARPLSTFGVDEVDAASTPARPVTSPPSLGGHHLEGDHEALDTPTNTVYKQDQRKKRVAKAVEEIRRTYRTDPNVAHTAISELLKLYGITNAQIAAARAIASEEVARLQIPTVTVTAPTPSAPTAAAPNVPTTTSDRDHHGQRSNANDLGPWFSSAASDAERLRRHEERSAQREHRRLARQASRATLASDGADADTSQPSSVESHAGRIKRALRKIARAASSQDLRGALSSSSSSAAAPADGGGVGGGGVDTYDDEDKDKGKGKGKGKEKATYYHH